MGTRLKETKLRFAALVLFPCVALCPALLPAQVGTQAAAGQASASPPPSTGGFFPLGELKRGMTATAWTVFSGTKPEPMAVEILGVLRGVRGPGHDMILAQLHGSKPEYTGVVAGMSGSPVYIGNRLLGSISYHIGNFSKDAIAGITPIEDMLEVRDLPIGGPLEQARSAPLNPAPAGYVQRIPPRSFPPGPALRPLPSRAGTVQHRDELPAHGNAAGDERLRARSHPPVAAENGGDRSRHGRGRRPWQRLVEARR